MYQSAIYLSIYLSLRFANIMHHCETSSEFLPKAEKENWIKGEIKYNTWVINLFIEEEDQPLHICGCA